MLRLPDVTLVLIETREHALAKLAIEDCLSKAEFGDVLIFTDKPSEFSEYGRVIEVPDWPEKVGWSRCFWYDVPLQLRTSHSLGIQWDSWIVDPGMWSDDFLQYDYIGSPWWYKDGLNVGNGGFSLRSTHLLRYVHKHRAKYPCLTDADDDLYCRKYRPQLQDAGFVWAPEKRAFDFAFECLRPDPTARHFGFHAVPNFDYGCEGDESRFNARVQLMLQSSYIVGRSVWSSFVAKFPNVMAKGN